MTQSDDVSFPQLESPNKGGLGSTATLQAAKASRKKRSPGSNKKKQQVIVIAPPRLTALISLNKSRKDLGLFLTMRGIRRSAQKQFIEESIREYNEMHPCAKYKDPTEAATSAKDRRKSVGRTALPSAHGPETCFTDGPKRLGPIKPSLNDDRTVPSITKSGQRQKDAKANRATRQIDVDLDRKLQRIENDRMIVLSEMNQRQNAVETLQRAQRMRQARQTVQNKRITNEQRAAATRVQSIFRGHQGRERAMAKSYRGDLQKEEALRREEKLHGVQKRSSQTQAGGAPVQHAADQEDAVLKIQAAARGRQGRRKANKIVRPMEFGLAGHQFKHSGRRRVSVAGAPMYRGVSIPDWGNKEKIAAKTASSAAPAHGDIAQLTRKASYLEAPDNPEMDMFRLMDKDGDGFVSPEDLMAFHQDEYGSIDQQTAASLQDLVAEADKDGDGKLNPEEFMLYCVGSRKVEEEKQRKGGPQEVQIVSAKVRRQQLINKLHNKRDQRHGRR